MYISIPVLIIIVLYLVMQSPASEVDDFFGSVFTLGLLILGLILGVGAIIAVGAFGVYFFEEIKTVAIMGLLLAIAIGIIYFAKEAPMASLKIVGSIVGVVGGFNLFVYGVQEHFEVFSYVVATILLVGCLCAWVPFVKNFKK